MRALLAMLVLTCGCRGLVELVERDPSVDATVDGAPAPECDAWPFAPAGIDACSVPAPDGALVLSGGTWIFDTNSGALTDPAEDVTFPASALVLAPDGAELRVMSVESLRVEVGGTLVLRGRRPLLAIVWSRADVLGTVDATSRSTGRAAGADPPACDALRATPGADSIEGAGGGGGGGLGRRGAAGGTGNDGLVSGGMPAMAAAPPIGLRGGCDGARGGNALGGEGGAGGGAVAIAAHDAVEVSGAIVAGGAGGNAAGGGRGGGGGGGSGGVVMLLAPAVHVTSAAIVAANGGGGGGGSDGTPAARGQDGHAGADVAPGGGGQGMGGAGGAGGANALDAAPGTNARRGGGGGGGGVGTIVFDSAALVLDTGAVVSPPP